MSNRRTSLFISHANPEDNPFTLWLGARLSALGYEVWADVFKLVGGFDWQQRLEEALRERTGKLLFVGSPEATGKQLVRNEIQIAYDLSKKIPDKEFIIPLRLRKFDAPFLIAHAQYVNFEDGWSQGLSELVEALEETYHFPRDPNSSNETLGYWRSVQLLHAQQVIQKEEQLISNWLVLNNLPKKIYVYDFQAGINIGNKEAAIDKLKLPIAPYSRGFIGFGALDEYQALFGPDLPLVVIAEVETEEFIGKGCPTPKIEAADARNSVSSILRQAIEDDLSRRGLSTFATSAWSQVFWPTIHKQPAEFLRFAWPNGPSGYRQITGGSKARKFFWHLGVGVRPRLFPIKHVRIGLHVIFTANGTIPIADAQKMHRLRRGFCKNWRNARWRDMLLAFLSWWGDGTSEIRIPMSPTTQFTLELPPLTFSSKVAPGLDIADRDPEQVDDDELVDEDSSEDFYEDLDEPDDSGLETDSSTAAEHDGRT